MVTLNEHYEELKDFFVTTLGVRTLTLQMVYDELTNPHSVKTADSVKSGIWSFSALIRTTVCSGLDKDKLTQSKIFPVVLPDGTVSVQSAQSAFAINDREYLAAQFRNKIKLLHYSMEEVRQLTNFFQWAGLTDRYLSASVKEITSISDGMKWPVRSKNRDLKKKVYALLRYVCVTREPIMPYPELTQSIAQRRSNVQEP